MNRVKLNNDIKGIVTFELEISPNGVTNKGDISIEGTFSPHDAALIISSMTEVVRETLTRWFAEAITRGNQN
jgi:hypothetical protein